MIELMTMILALGPIESTLGCAAPISQRFRQEERERMAWEDLREKEENDHWNLELHAGQLGDSCGLLAEQIARIDRNEHLDLAALRVEQVLGRVTELRKPLAAIQRAYDTLPELSGPSAEWHKRNLARKRYVLDDILHPENGELVRTTKALSRLIHALEGGQADLQAAKDARVQIEKLDRSLTAFRICIAPALICDSPLPLLIEIERQQRMMSEELRRMRSDILRGPPEPNKDEKK